MDGGSGVEKEQSQPRVTTSCFNDHLSQPGMLNRLFNSLFPTVRCVPRGWSPLLSGSTDAGRRGPSSGVRSSSAQQSSRQLPRRRWQPSRRLGKSREWSNGSLRTRPGTSPLLTSHCCPQLPGILPPPSSIKQHSSACLWKAQ